MSPFSVVHQVAVLAGLSRQDVEHVLRVGEIQTFNQGQVIFEELSSGQEWYIVLEGFVEIRVDPAASAGIEHGSVDLSTINRLGPGSSFGEIALIDQRPRSAGAVCARDDTQLLVISPQAFADLCHRHPDLGFTLMRNIAATIAATLRDRTSGVVQHLLEQYHARALSQELASSLPPPDAVTPLQTTIVIKDMEHFILSGPGRISGHQGAREEIEVFLFSRSGLARELTDQREPAADTIFNVLFSLIKCGQLPARVDHRRFGFHVSHDGDRRAGNLVVGGGAPEHAIRYTLDWTIKGVRFESATATTRASLFIYVYTDAAESPARAAEAMIAGIAMPVQRAMYAAVPGLAKDRSHYRVFTVHHRTHEVARTLRTLHELGYQLDTFIGIPYGEASWSTIVLLDHAADHQYVSLQAVRHPTKPTTYDFDFVQSSFLDPQTERELLAIFADSATTASYETAMQALIVYQLGALIAKCRANNERLLIYEDGGYIVPLIYAIYADPRHQLHESVKEAVDRRLIMGAVEVTTAGERKQRAAVASNGGVALLPVLSCARDDIKTIYESIGTAEAILTAASTALGNLGLPAFALRRVAVVGGNGAIGTRIVEQLSLAHNSTSNVFAVDIAGEPFSEVIPDEAFHHAAIKVKYHPIKRYTVLDRCLPIIINLPLDSMDTSGGPPMIRAAAHDFLADDTKFEELALTNSFPAPDAFLTTLWQETSALYGYSLDCAEALDDNRGMVYRLRRGDQCRRVTLLRPQVVLTFPNLERLIGAHVDTVIGITGLPIFSERDLDRFFARGTPAGGASDDVLVLISGSSKDYEFAKAIGFLNRLLAIQSDAFDDDDVHLAWFTNLYREQMSLVADEDAEAIGLLLAEFGRSRTVSIDNHPRVSRLIQQPDDGVDGWQGRLVRFIGAKIRRRLTIHKEIRPDIGSIYHLTIDGRRKRVVLLADGFVVNFYARYEKGVKTEYMDPVMTMQMLGLVRLSAADEPIAPGVYRMVDQLRREHMDALWAALNDQSCPLKVV